MAAATGLDLVKSGKNFSGDQYGLLVIGFACAFLTALLTVRWFIGFVKKHTFIPFGIYRICIAVAYMVIVLR
jgi:undecaprenyl-diphosphatase